MKKYRFCLFIFFITILPYFVFSQTEGNKSFLDKKYKEELALQSNFSFAAGYNLNSNANYPYAKVNIDFIEAWFDRIGVASVLAFSIGFDKDPAESLFIKLICPGINFSYEIGSGLYVSGGLNLEHNWHIVNENLKTENDTFQAKTVLRAYGLSIPLKIRYSINRNLSVFAEYLFSLHPQISAERAKNTKWSAENSFDAGLTFSLPLSF